MTQSPWPLFDLRLTRAEVALRPMTEVDLPTVAAILPEDLELNPAATTYPGLDTPLGRRVVAHQEYWLRWGRWSIPSWALTFVVEIDGRMVGTQTLEGEEFPTLRTVDSASWLIPQVRGRGVGKAMRSAVLALAFGPLSAQCAVTSAWDDNHASLGVSRAIGYQPNGQHRQRRDGRDGVGTMIHLRLTREDWLFSGAGDGVQITGFEACRPYFGV
ncbi:MAG TPA: GNAT family protein [Dermatophilaceae bacterium]|nr:GNAT family protein [Dermatophilaceae bacterium]